MLRAAVKINEHTHTHTHTLLLTGEYTISSASWAEMQCIIVARGCTDSFEAYYACYGGKHQSLRLSFTLRHAGGLVSSSTRTRQT